MMAPTKMNLRSIYDRSLDAFDASRFLDVGSIALERGHAQGLSEAAAARKPDLFVEHGAPNARRSFKRAATMGADLGASLSRNLTPPTTSLPRIGTSTLGTLFGSRRLVGQSTGTEYALGFTGLLEFAARGVMYAAGLVGGGVGAIVGATCGSVSTWLPLQRDAIKAGASKGAAVGFNVAGAPIAVCLGILMGLGRSVGFAIDQVVGTPLVLGGALVGTLVAAPLIAYRAACALREPVTA